MHNMFLSKYYLLSRKVRIVTFLCIAMFCESRTIFAQQPTQTITHKGNVFVLQNMADTVTLFNPETTEVTSIINNPHPVPVKLNNMSIYAKGDVDTEPSVTCDMLRTYIVQLLNKQLYTLDDGEYRLKLSNVIVSDYGKIVYYNFDGLEKMYTKKVITPGTDNIHATAHGATNSRQALLSWKKVDYKTNKYYIIK